MFEVDGNWGGDGGISPFLEVLSEIYGGTAGWEKNMMI